MMPRFFSLLPIFASVVLVQQVNTSRGGVVTPPLPKPRFVLTDTSGAAFDFRQRTDRYVTLLFFGYRNCPDQCPMHMANLGGALKNLPAGTTDQVKLVFVTTDPARDSPAAVRCWLDLFDRRFTGLTGTERAIEAVERAADVSSATKRDQPTATTGWRTRILCSRTPKDNLAHVIYPGGVSKDDWVHDLPLLIKETWMRRPE
ncbi:MAG: SCO family protein [Bryobacteraceae bacterium]